jgi:hypothetical protein
MTKATTRKRRGVRLGLERLEPRDCPAVAIWEGDVSGNWATPGNWDTNMVPDNTTDVLLIALGAGCAAPTVANGTAAETRNLMLGGTYNGAGLTVNGTLTVGNIFDWQDKAVDLLGTGRLNVKGTMYWGDGVLSVANLNVYGGGKINVGEKAASLQSQSVTVGADAAGNLSIGSIILSPDLFTIGRMDGNLSLGANTVITNRATGSIEFHNQADSATKGGIATGNNVIQNLGTVWVRFADAAGQGLHIGVGVANVAATAMLDFGQAGQNVAVHFNDPVGGGRSISQTAGTVRVVAGSRVDLDDGMIVGAGNVTIKDAIQTEAWLVGDLTFNGGALNIGPDDVVGGELTLHTGNFNWLDGILRVAVDGRVSDAGDKILAAGNVNIQGGFLDVNTHGGAAVKGNKWDIVQASGLQLGTDFGGFLWAGLEPGGYAHGKTGPNYRLAKGVDIRGVAWADNGNGLRAAGEGLLGGITVKLYTTGNVLLATTVTAGDGSYSFANVLAGSYYVTFSTAFPGAGFAPADQGSDDAADSDVTAWSSSGGTLTGQTATFALSGLADLLFLDAGLTGWPEGGGGES